MGEPAEWKFRFACLPRTCRQFSAQAEAEEISALFLLRALYPNH
jgi:hypothetical protein